MHYIGPKHSHSAPPVQKPGSPSQGEIAKSIGEAAKAAVKPQVHQHEDGTLHVHGKSSQKGKVHRHEDGSLHLHDGPKSKLHLHADGSLHSHKKEVADPGSVHRHEDGTLHEH